MVAFVDSLFFFGLFEKFFVDEFCERRQKKKHERSSLFGTFGKNGTKKKYINAFLKSALF